jgi:hypothetical protein
MKFTIEPVNYFQWKLEIETLKKEKKWLMHLPHDKKIEFYTIKMSSANRNFSIGAGYFFKKDEMEDWSFLIYPEFQKRGFARSFVKQQLNEIRNLQFTVSKFNKASLGLFRSIEEIQEVSYDQKINTYVFRGRA